MKTKVTSSLLLLRTPLQWKRLKKKGSGIGENVFNPYLTKSWNVTPGQEAPKEQLTTTSFYFSALLSSPPQLRSNLKQVSPKWTTVTNNPFSTAITPVVDLTTLPWSPSGVIPPPLVISSPAKQVTHSALLAVIDGKNTSSQKIAL